MLTDALVEAVLTRARHKKPSQKEVQDLTFSLVNSMLTTEQYVDRRWPGVKIVIPEGMTVRELIVGRPSWDEALPESVVAIDVNLAEADLLDPRNHALGPWRWLGIYHLLSGLAKALHGDLDPQTWNEAMETVASLAGLIKPAYKKLTEVQIALMAVAHDAEGDGMPWEDWLDQVNDYLNGWQRNTIEMPKLRHEVADFREKGFVAYDDGARLRLPTSLIVVSIKRLQEIIKTVRP